ncbi:unnamed protein product, partial [Ectocarpus sp. 12 AP-2014]
MELKPIFLRTTMHTLGMIVDRLQCQVSCVGWVRHFQLVSRWPRTSNSRVKRGVRIPGSFCAQEEDRGNQRDRAQLAAQQQYRSSPQQCQPTDNVSIPCMMSVAPVRRRAERCWRCRVRVSSSSRARADN